MKISIKNFGPIDHFEFDLEKDLHVIYGENNIGKSYAISVVYLILKNIDFWIHSDESILKEYLSKEKIESLIREKGEFKANELVERILEKYYKDFLEDLQKSFRNTFSETKNLISKKNFAIDILTEYFQIFVQNKTLSVKLLNDVLIRFTYEITESEPRKKIFWVSNKEIDWKELDRDFGNNIFNKMYYYSKNELNYLPASISGIYQGQSFLSGIFAQLAQLRHELKGNIEIPNFTEPTSDFLLKISKSKSNVEKKLLSKFTKKIEDEILKAKIQFNDTTKRIEFVDNSTGLTLELANTSSMVAELAVFVGYLKYVVEEKEEILFIEEPEAHLHPKIQVEMMKIFVEMAKAGVKVVITTHSDFMMNELSNLLLAKEIDAEKVASYHLVMDEKRGSYDAGDMKATSEGIEDYNFTDVAIKQYERRIEILEKLNQDAVRQD